MSRAASAAASLPLRNSIRCRTGRPHCGTSWAWAMVCVVMCESLRDQFRKQRYAQLVRQPGGFRRLGQRSGRAGLDTAQAPFAVAVIDALQFALELAIVIGLAPGQAEIRTDQVAQAAMDALALVEHRHPADARSGEVVPDGVARRGDKAAGWLGFIAPERFGLHRAQVALRGADTVQLLELGRAGAERALVGCDCFRMLAGEFL